MFPTHLKAFRLLHKCYSLVTPVSLTSLHPIPMQHLLLYVRNQPVNLQLQKLQITQALMLEVKIS